MADQKVSTDITANASQANREFNGWAANVQAAANAAKAALGGVASNTKALQSQMAADLGKIEGAVGAVTKRYAAWAAALAGGAVLKDTINTTAAFTREATGLGKALGINTNEAAVLNIALRNTGNDADAMTGAASKMAKQLRTNEASLNGMGLATRDANGNFRNMQDLLLDGIKIVNSYAEGTDRTIAQQTMFGKGADDITGLLKLSARAIDDARAKQEALGLVVGVNNVEAAARYKRVMNDVSDVLLAMKKAIGDAVMPMFTKLSEWFAAAGPAAVFVLRGALGGLMTVFWGLKNAAVMAWEVIDSMVFSVAEPIKTVAEAMVKLLSGDFKGAGETLMSMPDRYAQRWGNAWKSIVASSQEAQDRIKDLFIQGPAAKGGGGGGKHATGNEGNAGQQNRMAEWETQLAEQRAALTRQGLLEGQYREMSKAAEQAYWADLKGRRDLSAQERIALSRKTAEAELADVREGFEVKVRTLQAEAEAYRNNIGKRIALEQQIQAMYAAGTKQYEESERRIAGLRRQLAEQDRQVRQLQVQDERDARLQEIAIAEHALQEAQQLGIVNQRQVLQAQAEFENQRNAIAREALQERLQAALLDPDKNPVEIARLHNEIEQLERQHQQRMAQIRTQTSVDSARGITDTLGGIESSWTALLKKMSTGTMTIGGFVRGLFQGVWQSLVDTGAKALAQWAIQQISMRVLGKATALSGITGEAAKAGAGGVASMAAAPWPLNMTAPAFGAAMSAAAMAFAPVAVSAANGFDIPAGVNPMVQAHQREMILPQHLGDTVRDMAQVYAQSRGNGSGGDTHNWTVQAMDAHSFERFLGDNGSALVRVMQRKRRDFAW